MARLTRLLSRSAAGFACAILLVAGGPLVPGAKAQSDTTPSDAPEVASNAATTLLTDWLQTLDGRQDVTVRFDTLEAGDRSRSAILGGLEIRYHPESGTFLDTGEIELVVRSDEVRFDGLRGGATLLEAASIAVPGSLDISVVFTPDTVVDADKVAANTPDGSFEFSYEDLLIEGISTPIIFPGISAAATPGDLLKAGFEAARQVRIARMFSAMGTASTRFRDGPSSSALYEDIAMIGLEDGRIAEQSIATMRQIEELVALQPDEPAQNLEISARDVVVQGFDIVPLAALAGVQVPGDRNRVLGRETISDMKIATADGTVEIESFLIEDIQVTDMTPLSVVPLINREAAGEAIDDEELAKAAVEALGVFSLGQFEISDLKFKGPQGEGAMRRFALSDLSGDGLGQIAGDGLDIRINSQGSVYIDHIGLGNVTFPSLKALIALEGVEEPTPAQLMEVMPTFGKFIISALEVAESPDTSDSTGGENSPLFSLSLVELLQGGHVANIPTRSSLIVDGLTVPVAELDEPELQALLGKLGIDELEFNHAFSMDWDPATRDLDLRNMTAQVHGAGTISLSLRLGNVPATLFTSPDMAQIALAGASFKSARIRLEGDELVSALLADQAQTSGLTDEQLAAGLTDGLRDQLGPVAQSDFGVDLIAAFGGFLSDPDDLVIELAPNSPVAMTELLGLYVTSPASLPERLGAKVLQ